MRALLLCVIIASCASCNSQTGATGGAHYYVSPQGDDTSDGTTPSRAFRTLQFALEAAQSGDTVELLAGTHTQSAWITDQIYNPPLHIISQSGAILDGRSSHDEGLLIAGCTVILIAGLTVRNYRTVGINILSSASRRSRDIIINDCTVHNCGFDSSAYDWDHEGYGINAKYSDAVTISGNTVYANGPSEEITATYGALGTGINTFDLRDSSITGNTARVNRGGGILVEDGVNVTVQDNSCSGHRASSYFDPAHPELGTWHCGGIWIDGGNTVLLSGNTFEDNIAGVLISNIDKQIVRGYQVTDNTIAGNTAGIEILHFDETTPSEILLISGNVFSENDTDIIRP